MNVKMQETPVSIDGPFVHEASACESILRSLPMWFGIESTLQDYVRNTEELPTFIVRVDDTLCGFVSLKRHFESSWELYCIAIHYDWRGKGLGRKLLRHAETWAAQQGARWLQVKTLAESADSPEYAETRRFYVSVGFEPLEVFPTLWTADHPCLQMMKRIDSALG